MLTENQILKHRKAVESLYSGTCTIINSEEYERTDGSTGFHDVVICENQPCRLSHSSNPIATIGKGETATANQSIKLFLSPEIVVKSGSRITVTQCGITETFGFSSISKVYETHQVIELTESELAGNG